MMENREHRTYLEKMKAITAALADGGNGKDAMKLLVSSIADYLSEDELAREQNGERQLLVDILSNNVVWVANTGIARQREQATIAAKEKSLQEVHQTLLKKNMMLRERTMIDDLTGLFNRRYFERSLSYDLERFKRYYRPIGVVLFDIDHFKRINDTYGHSVGDAALQHLADAASRLIRSADILARYGGEEFTLLLPETTLDGARITAERLRQYVADTPLESHKGQISMTVSCGVTSVEGEFKGTMDDVMGRVDKALYKAKDLGRNKVVVA